MTEQSACFQFDDVRVDAAAARAWKAGRPVAIEPKAFRVLLYLIENRSRLVEKDELLSVVWPDTFVTENALARAIAHLRKALGDRKNPAHYIETAPTRGYRFIAPVSLCGSAADARAAWPQPLEPTTSVSSLWSTRGRSLTLAASLLIALLALATWWAFPRRAASTALLSPRRMQATSSSGMDIFASFSPDGSTIAYSSDSTGKLEIYLKQLTPGGRIVQLTDDGNVNLQPAWSPDGKTIAFHAMRSGGIWLVPALGGAPRQVTTFGSSPAWSPDGSQIVFQSAGLRDLSATADVSIANSTLWTVSLADGSTHQITQPTRPAGAHNSPAWSPDGKSIVFTVSDFGNDAGLWIMRTDGSSLHRLAPGGGVFNPVFSRDSSSIYLGALRLNDFAVWKIPASGSEDFLQEHAEKIASTFPSIPRYLAVSPDGHSLAYSDVRTLSELHAAAFSPQTGQAVDWPVPLTEDTRFRKVLPRFSPDGKRILFGVGSVSFENGTWVMDADGKNATQISSGCSSAAWLPSGQEFVCWDSSRAPHERVLAKYRLDTKRKEVLRSLPETGFYLAASPDGKSVALMSADSGAPNLWLASIAGGDIRQLTFDRELAGFAAFSPDGKSIAYEQKRGDTTNVMVMPISGGTPRQLTNSPGQSWPHSWSPDGKKIAFAGLRSGIWNVWSVSVADGREKQITPYTQANHYVRYPSWSPDGKRIVYEYGETTANIWIVALN